MIRRSTAKFKRLIKRIIGHDDRQRAKRFSRIYAEKKWGGKHALETDFHSGTGSLPENTLAYELMVAEFVQAHGIRSIVDVGCGDFQVAARILQRIDSPVSYVGCDVVESLIERNNRVFGTGTVRFECIDAVVDALPEGELILVREVLQHLSNRSVSLVLGKIRSRPWSLITNSVHVDMTTANVDIAEGRSTRVAQRSGLDITQPPFSVRAETLLDLPHTTNAHSILRTVLVAGTPDEARGE